MIRRYHATAKNIDRSIILPIFLYGTLISSAACGITSNPIKRNGVMQATLNTLPRVVPVPDSHICPVMLAPSPLTAEPTTRRIPAIAIIAVRTVCNIAAVFAPLILINVINTATPTPNRIVVR